MVAKSNTAKKSSKTGSVSLSSILSKTDNRGELDGLIHERTRLAIVSALATSKKLSFNDLKAALQVSDGNLSSHARKLEDAGYIRCNKEFDGRVPRTHYALTAKGRKALKRYISHMEALINAMKTS